MTTPDQVEGTTRPLDPINPYAVISLVAALLGLFPVAIVFGILAFTRPAGRGIAIAGLGLGVIELAAVVFVFFGVTTAFTDDSSDSAIPSLSISTTDFTTIPAATTTSTTTAAPALEPPAADTPTPTDAATPSVVIGDYCTTREAQAVTADGSTVYCARRAGTDAYLWAANPGVVPNPDLPQQAPQTPEATGAPAIGSSCSTSELGQVRPSASGQRVKCGYTGEDSVLWLALD